MKLIKLLTALLICLFALSVSAQNYTPKVSRDSVASLKHRLEILQTSVKLHELKLAEADQEADIEKQEIKVRELKALEKTTAEESSKLSDAAKDGKEQDIKKAEKMSRKAANTSKSLNNAVERLQKQMDKVEETRGKIRTEESKLAGRSLLIHFSVN